MGEWGIGGIAVALVDDRRTVWVEGFGEAKADSVFRCGSISKLFTAIAVMQLVEEGKLTLDAPLESFAPGLLPVVPFSNTPPVTLRQVLCHRSGLIREPPVGGYFDDTEPGMKRTVESLAGAVLPTPPNAKTRYSNAGPTLAGRVVELLAQKTFGDYQRERILGPLDMSTSFWTRREIPRGRLIPSSMQVADGRGGFVRQPSPVFDLGTVAAGNLFTTAGDLGRFVAMLAAGGEAAGGRILRPGTLDEMFTPQLTTEPAGFGLGFMVSRFRQHKSVSHNGAVYGYSSSLVFLPEQKVGVVVLSNEDLINARIQKLANLALSLMLEVKLAEKPPGSLAPIGLSPGELAAFAGDYESESFWATLKADDSVLQGQISGQPTRFTPVGARRFLAESRLHDATPAVFETGDDGHVRGFVMGPQTFRRVALGRRSIPAQWRGYLGSYGPRFIPLVISERNGNLYAMTENMVDYRLTPVNRHVFAFPPGLYGDEHLVLLGNGKGKPRFVSLANMVLKRR